MQEVIMEKKNNNILIYFFYSLFLTHFNPLLQSPNNYLFNFF